MPLANFSKLSKKLNLNPDNIHVQKAGVFQAYAGSNDPDLLAIWTVWTMSVYM